MPLAQEAKAIAATLCTLIAFMAASSIAAKPSTRNRAEIPDEFRWDFGRLTARRKFKIHNLAIA